MAHRELPIEQNDSTVKAGEPSALNDLSSKLLSSKPGEHIKLTANSNDDFSKFFQDANKDINKKVEQTIRDGVFIAPERPTPGGAGKASELAEGLADRARTGLPKLEHNMPMLGPDGKEKYNKDVDLATKDIQRREEDIANRHWKALTPAQQQTIASEKYARDTYNSQTVYRTNPQPPATPNLDRFKASLAKELEPLETERAETYRQVWQEMPVEEKAAIIRKIEQNKRWQFK
ncbi:MAG: hypothetical protein K2X77_14600 [Candidatus Obscuribacterales bacterium]|nr:hypothetical protein [Candidatus Obscuribacterales bacterium]